MHVENYMYAEDDMYVQGDKMTDLSSNSQGYQPDDELTNPSPNSQGYQLE